MKPNDLPPHAQLMNFIVGKWISKPIYVAAELGIADILADGSKSVDEIGQACGAHTPSLYRMMRALASVGIFSETKEERFELTPMAELLKTGAMRSIVILFNADWSDKAWERFLESIKTGETAFEKAHGMPLTDWLEKNPQAEEIFNEANAIKAAHSHGAIVDAYDFKSSSTLMDVGGGLGTLMAAILSGNPSMRGTIADIPSVIKQARKTIRSQKLEGRCELIECDFFKRIPAGSEAYLLSNILHDWSDTQCMTILRNCHKAMNSESKLLIVEMIVPLGNQPSIAKLLDLEMMVTTGGRERTESEFKALLESSGFRLSRIIETQENVCIIEGIRLEAISKQSFCPTPA